MARSRPALAAALALAATLTFVGVSAALEGEDPTLAEPEVSCPDATDDGTTDDGTTDDGTTDATDESSEDGCDEADGDDAGTTDGTEADDTDGEVAEPESGPVDNHGAAVSEAAHECPTGPEHGPCVREVAKSDAGKPGDEELSDGTAADDEDAAGTGSSGAPAAQGKAKGKQGR